MKRILIESESIKKMVLALAIGMALAAAGCGGGGTTPPAGSDFTGDATGGGPSGFTPHVNQDGEEYSLSRYFNFDDEAVYGYDDNSQIIFGFGPVNLYPFLSRSYGSLYQFQFKVSDPEQIDTSFYGFSQDGALMYYGRYERESGVGVCVVFDAPVQLAPGTVTSGSTYTAQVDFTEYTQCGPAAATEYISGSVAFSFTIEGEDTISTTAGEFSVLEIAVIESWSGTYSSSQSVSGTREITYWMVKDAGPMRYENSDTGMAYHSVNTAVVGDTIYTSLDSVCGNAQLEMGEECDDGNVVSGDGCSSVCRDESLWIKTYGGASDDGAAAIEQTADGGFIVAGYNTPEGASATDMWLMKLNTAGAQTWSATFGGSAGDTAHSVRQTADGGYIVAGCTESAGAGGADAWLLKVDSSGAQEWEHTYGGASDDCAGSVTVASGGGYLLAGHTESAGAGGADAWLLKVDSSGAKEWEQTYGGASDDYAYSAVEAHGGGYVFAGTTESYGAGMTDVWIVKTDTSGSEVWTQTYGARKDDYAYSIGLAAEERYIVTGRTESYGLGGSDAWVLLLNESGNHVWTRAFGGPDDEATWSVAEMSDGSFIVAGEKPSSGVNNIWMLNISVTGGEIWTREYGGSYADSGKAILQASDGSFALAGVTGSTMNGGSDAWIMRTDTDGDCDQCLDTIVLLRQQGD